MWQFLHRLASFRDERRTENDPARPHLETLEGRLLLSAGSVDETIVASYSRASLVGMTMQNQLTVSRFDPQTGDEHVLFNKVADSSPYGGETIGQVAAANNGDVVVAVNSSDWMQNLDSSKLHGIDVKNGAQIPLFTTQKSLRDYAVAPNGSLVAAQLGGTPLAPAVEISRFDPHTGDRQLLASEPLGTYDSAGQVAVAADGDVIFSVNRSVLAGTGQTDVFRYDEQTKTTSPLFSTDERLDDLAIDKNGGVVATFSKEELTPGGGPLKVMGVSRFDPQTGHEDVLYSVNHTGTLYESASPVAVASDGDVIFSLGESATWDPSPTLPVQRIDSQTGQVSTLFSVPGLVGLAVVETPPNHPPVAAPDAYHVVANTTRTVNAANGVLANDSDPDHDALSATLASGPSHGTLTLHTDGSFVYKPNANFVGTDSFSYKASDGSLASDPTTVTLHVVPPDRAPLAANDSYSLNEDHVLTVMGKGVLANDVDPDGDHLTAVLVGGPSHGTLTLHPDGSFVYKPNANFNGTDVFTYKASDGTLLSGTARVTIRVNPVNDPPVGHADSYSLNEDHVLTITGKGVLANDFDVDGDHLTAVLVTGPKHGTLTLHPDGSFVYKPNANFNGTDTFVYRARDGSTGSDPVTVTIHVNPVNDAPVAVDDVYSLQKNHVLTVSARGKGVLANDFDVDHDALSAILVTAPRHGKLTLNADGTFAYTPDANYVGPDRFLYRASDSKAGSNLGVVQLLIMA